MPRPSSHRGVVPQHIPTQAQLNLIAELFVDCCYSTSIDRKSFLLLRFDKPFADELNGQQASKVIEELMQQRERMKRGPLNRLI